MTGGADPSDALTQQGHYAGAVTRLVAFVLDQAIVTGLFAVTLAVSTWVLNLVVGRDVTWQPSVAFSSAAFAVWWLLYYAYPWAASGKTPGMATLGIRVVRADGAPASAGNAVKRALALPLTFLTLGIGFLPIVFGRRRRALHDRIGGTAVVYSWDARGAKLRFLARQRDTDEVSTSA